MKNNFKNRLLLGLLNLTEYPLIFFCWIYWIITNKDIAKSFIKYKSEFTIELFKEDKNE